MCGGCKLRLLGMLSWVPGSTAWRPSTVDEKEGGPVRFARHFISNVVTDSSLSFIDAQGH